MVNAQGISLPSPLGEGLGVRPVGAGGEAGSAVFEVGSVTLFSPSFNAHIIPYEN